MPNLVFLCGIPASGKSTYADKLAYENNATVVSTDEIRGFLFGDEAVQYDSLSEKIANVRGVHPARIANERVYSLAESEIINALSGNKTVLFDATNISRRNRKSTINHVKEQVPNLHCYAIVLAVDLCEALRRNAERKRSVPVGVINRMFEVFEMPTAEEGFDGVRTISVQKPCMWYDNPTDWEV